MPNKKGSRVAASQARAKVAAKKKAHASRPDLTAARVAPAQPAPDQPAEDTEPTEGAQETSLAMATDHVPAAAAPAPRTTHRTATRRERQALTAFAAGNLKREVLTIGVLATLSAIALVTVKLATDLGRS